MASVLEVRMISETTSYWLRSAKTKDYEPLKANLEVNNLIIGGGISGVTTAYLLAKKGEGAETALIEAGTLGCGGTGNSTAKVTIQHDCIYSRIIAEEDFSVAKLYYEAQNSSLNEIKKIIKDEKIDCDFKEETSYIYAEDLEQSEIIEKEYDAAQRLGIESEYITTPRFPKNCVSKVAFFNQGVFHPIKYIDALTKKAEEKCVRFYNNTKAVTIKEDDSAVVIVENGCVIKANNVVIATRYPIYDMNNFLFTKLYPKRGYAVAVTPRQDVFDGNYKKSGEPSRSLREHREGKKTVAIAQGETHFTGRCENTEQNFSKIFDFVEEEVGIKEKIAKWSMQDYETPDGMPFIGKLKDRSRIYIAAGFGRWGMTNGTLSGMVISDLILNGGNRFEEMLSPKRAENMTNAKTMATEVTKSVGELMKSKVEPLDNLENMKAGEGKVIKYHGKKAGIYLDEYGTATILDISCKHLSTILNFNSAEKSWDCPAHGGRFTVLGEVIEGPPKSPLKVLFHGKYSDITKAD